VRRGPALESLSKRLVLTCAAAHFAAAFITGASAYGLDFDQLRSRSVVSTVAGHIHDVLMGPHGMIIRALPNRWLVQRTIPLIPIWLVLHSILWGVVIALLVAWYRRSRSRTLNPQS
jgi:hypothetical protein